MAYKLVAALALATLATADCSASAGGTCVTSGGSWLQIISPFAGSTATVGQDITVTWGVCGTDPSFLYGNVTFEIADASNSNNVQSISGGQFISTPVSAGTATAKVPALPNSAKYTIKSSYHDNAANKWISCFGNTFAITGGVAPAGNSSATVVPTTKSSGFVAAAGAAGVAAAAILLA
ncbi:UNVERIFIED_CONTAM: hypothetical protein HDU68_003914 [Siphonaria sp. JEL0065]|nr:hypothetical protein HDU68_003914 [Siphonaria sp. JEL0065]